MVLKCTGVEIGRFGEAASAAHGAAADVSFDGSRVEAARALARRDANGCEITGRDEGVDGALGNPETTRHLSLIQKAREIVFATVVNEFGEAPRKALLQRIEIGMSE